MPPPAQPADRYEPLPGLLGLPGVPVAQALAARPQDRAGARRCCCWRPGWWPRSCSARASPSPTASGRRSSGGAEQRARAAERARLAAEQRPRTGQRSAPGGAAAAVAGVEARDHPRRAARRAATGELRTRAQRTDCRTLGRDGGRLLLALHRGHQRRRARPPRTPGRADRLPVPRRGDARDRPLRALQDQRAPRRGLVHHRRRWSCRARAGARPTPARPGAQGVLSRAPGSAGLAGGSAPVASRSGRAPERVARARSAAPGRRAGRWSRSSPSRRRAS